VALNIEVQSKRCSGCRDTLPLSAFGRDVSQVSCLNIYCKSCIRARARKRTDTDSYRKYQRDYMRRRLHNDPVFKAKHTAYTTAWRKENPERYRELHELGNHRRAMRSLENDHEEGITLKSVMERDGGTCGICEATCAREDASIDHIKPVSLGGGHVWANVQLAHRACNSMKSDSYVS